MTVTSVSESSAGTRTQAATCRFCSASLEHTFVDLGMSPLCESFLALEELNQVEHFYPLHVWVCDRCYLVQLQEYVSPDAIFHGSYAYYSSYSESWLRHAKRYCDSVTERFSLGQDSLAVEIASNDGYLLLNFVQAGIPALGIEPSGNVAAAAREKGVETLELFFGRETARRVVDERGHADLIAGNNVLAHVPDLNDFVGGLSILVAEGGVITMEFPHLMRLMERNQFDTIYHEHFSYLSFLTTQHVFAAHGLTLFDVEELESHGGSLRIYAQPSEGGKHTVSDAVRELAERETSAGFASLEHYSSFTPRVESTKRRLLSFLIQARDEGKTVAGYGAPGKGNTLLNYCGIRTDLLAYTVDRNPHKHGMFCPGTRIPIFAPEHIEATRPDYILILPWNLEREIMKQLEPVRAWGARFVVPIPELHIHE